MFRYETDFGEKYVKNNLNIIPRVGNYKQNNLLNIVWADICVNTK